MGAGRGDGAGGPAEPGDERLDHQSMAFMLIDLFADHDATGLAALDAAGRAEQLQARQALYDYVDRIWEGAKARGLNPANRPDWSVVAGPARPDQRAGGPSDGRPVDGW